MLSQLPMGMMADDFFRRFVTIFQQVGTTLLEDVDTIEHLPDLTVAPPEMVRWLGAWIGTEVTPDKSPDQARLIVQTAAQTLAWRGTRWGLVSFLELLGCGAVQVEENGGVSVSADVAVAGATRAAPSVAVVPSMTIHVETRGKLSEGEFLALVLEEVPAHVHTQVHVAGQQVWPPLPAVSTAQRPPEMTP
jgi:phage tail-like protein